MHFTELKKNELNAAKQFIDAAVEMSSQIGFKAVAIRYEHTGNRLTDEIVFKLHEHLLLTGVEHELSTGRFQLPRRFVVLKDKDDGADKLRLAGLRSLLAEKIPAKFGERAEFTSISAGDSSENLMLQLVDLFTGAVMRRLNRKEGADLNHKDILSDYIWEKFHISIDDDAGDFAKMFIIE